LIAKGLDVSVFTQAETLKVAVKHAVRCYYDDRNFCPEYSGVSYLRKGINHTEECTPDNVGCIGK
jgi:hypothetical protein